MKLKAILNVAVGAAMAVGMGAVTAPAAHAAARDGICDAGEFCYFYNSGLAGSVSDFTGSVSDYGTNPASCYVFKSAGAGQGLCIKNNAASVWNRSSVPVTVFYNTGFGGASQVFTAGGSGNLNTTLKNNEASHQFGTSGASPIRWVTIIPTVVPQLEWIRGTSTRASAQASLPGRSIHGWELHSAIPTRASIGATPSIGTMRPGPQESR
jgi:hypothetical protein